MLLNNFGSDFLNKMYSMHLFFYEYLFLMILLKIQLYIKHYTFLPIETVS